MAYPNSKVILTNSIIFKESSNFIPGRDGVLTWGLSGGKSEILPSDQYTIYNYQFYDRIGTLYVNTDGTINYGNFNTPGPYDVIVNFQYAGAQQFHFDVQGPKPDVPIVPVINGYNPNVIDIISPTYSNSSSLGLTPGRSTLISWELRSQLYGSLKIYTEATKIDFQSPQSGTISVNNSGTVNYSNFNFYANDTYSILVTMKYVDTPFVLVLNVNIPQGPEPTPEPEPPAPTPGVLSYCCPNATLKFGDTNTYYNPLDSTPGYLIATSWSINGVSYNIDPNTENTYQLNGNNTGNISINSSGNITYGGFIINQTNNVNFLIKTSTSIGKDATFYLTILGSPTTFAYDRPEAVVGINATGTVSLLPADLTYTVNYWTVNNVKQDTNKFSDNNEGYIQVSNTGTLTYGGFIQKKTYDIFVNVTTNGQTQDVPFRLTTTSIVIQYAPATDKIGYATKEAKAVLVGNQGYNVNIAGFSITVGNGAPSSLYPLGTKVDFGTGYIQVDSKGTISYGNFDSDATYKVLTSVNGDNVLFTLTVLKGATPKPEEIPWYLVPYYGLELWIWLLIAFVIILIIIGIAVGVTVKNTSTVVVTQE